MTIALSWPTRKPLSQIETTHFAEIFLQNTERLCSIPTARKRCPYKNDGNSVVSFGSLAYVRRFEYLKIYLARYYRCAPSTAHHAIFNSNKSFHYRYTIAIERTATMPRHAYGGPGGPRYRTSRLFPP